MPHIIIDCSDSILQQHDRQQIMQLIFDAADESRLFNTQDIKVRLRSFSDFLPAADGETFLHVFAYIMEGRTTAQKNGLSKSIVSRLKLALPDVPVISMNVIDIEKATYNNRDTV